MKLKKEYVLYSATAEQTLAIATGDEAKRFKGVLKANDAAGFILNCLQEETTEDEVLEKLIAEYNASPDVLHADLLGVLEQLRSVGALED